jgi:subtilisin family serine protease
LDFIYGLYTSTASDSASFCSTDFAGASNDCRRGFAGTSQATPHVTGAVALMRAVNLGLTPVSVKTILCTSARDIGAGSKQGCGRLDVYRAMAASVLDPSP